MKELSQVVLLSLVPRLHSGCLQIIQDLHHCHDEVRPYSVLKTWSELRYTFILLIFLYVSILQLPFTNFVEKDKYVHGMFNFQVPWYDSTNTRSRNR